MIILNLIIQVVIFLFLPLIAGGIIRKIRARAQGRKGPPVLQNFYDFVRLFQKKPIDGPNSGFYSEVAPVFALFACLIFWSIVVFEWTSFLLIPFFLALYRLSIVSYAMETGTSFGGLGASRETLLSISAEPIILLSILIAQSKIQIAFNWIGLVLGIMLLSSFMVAVLAELAKPPFDDPRTHLELTMVHEAMLLEASGRSMAFFEASSQIKIASFFTLLIRIGFEHSEILDDPTIPRYIINLLIIPGALLLSALVGYWEASSVRRKWSWVPEIMGMTFLFILVLGTLIKL